MDEILQILETQTDPKDCLFNKDLSDQIRAFAKPAVKKDNATILFTIIQMYMK